MANKKFEDIKDYADNKEGGRRREYRKKYSKKNRRDIPKNQGEIKDDVDSDGFEIVGSKEEKKQKFRDEHRGDYIPRRGRGNWKRNKYWKRRDHENEKKEEKEEKEEGEDKEEGEEEKEVEKKEEEEKKEKKEEEKKKEKKKKKKPKRERREKWDKKDKKERRKEEKKKEKRDKIREKLEQPNKVVIVSSSGAKSLKDLIG